MWSDTIIILIPSGPNSFGNWNKNKVVYFFYITKNTNRKKKNSNKGNLFENIVIMENGGCLRFKINKEVYQELIENIT